MIGRAWESLALSWLFEFFRRMAKLCQGLSEVVSKEGNAHRARISWSATAARARPLPKAGQDGPRIQSGSCRSARKISLSASRGRTPNRAENNLSAHWSKQDACSDECRRGRDEITLHDIHRAAPPCPCRACNDDTAASVSKDTLETLNFSPTAESESKCKASVSLKPYLLNSFSR